MPIEVRQLLIRATVGDGPAQAARSSDADGGASASGGGAGGCGGCEGEGDTQLKEDILSECKAWFEQRLRQMAER